MSTWEKKRHLRKPLIRYIATAVLVLWTITLFPAARAAEAASNQTIKAGVFFFDGYHMKDENDNLTGYDIEFLSLVSEYSHLNFEYVGYDKSWSDMLTMLENGEIDLVTSARKTPERESRFAFSQPIGRNNTVLSVRADNTELRGGDYSTYDGMKVGVLAGSSQNQSLEKFAAEEGFSYDTEVYQDAESLAADLQGGQIDAILSSDLRRATNEKTLDTIETDYYYAVVRKEDTALLDEINYAIDQMNINEGDWPNVMFYKYYGHIYASGLSFTEREKAYIQDVLSGKKTITVTSMGDRKPYSYVEDHQLKGILPEYFAEVMKAAGLPYEVVIPGSRAEYYDLVEHNGVDVVIDKRTFEATPEVYSNEGFNTDVYMTTGIAKVSRKDFQGDISTVAIAEEQGNTPIEQGLTEDAQILAYPTREEALRAVLEQKADAAYVYTYTAQLFVNNDITDALRYDILNDIGFAFKMYVRSTCDHELASILNKCIRQIPEDTLTRLVTDYTAYTSGHITLARYMRAHPQITALLVVAAAVVIGLILYFFSRAKWNKRLLDMTEQANKELAKQFAIVDTLSRDYLNVYAVNVHNATAKFLKAEGYIPSVLEDVAKEFPYTPTIQHYIKERVHPEDQAYLTEALSIGRIAEELNSSNEYNGTYRILVDGEVHSFQFTLVKIDERNGHENNRILAGFRNIDRIVQREQEQKAVLSDALAQAQRANIAKTTFLNNMSHDMRTPMNAVIGFTSLAMKHIDNRGQVENYLGKILTSGKHLLNLINDVLDMSRIESGKVKMEEKAASLREIMQDLKTIVQADIKAKQLDFHIDTVDVVNETIICDRLRLDQVLLNILSNAIKYTKPGGSVWVRIIQTGQTADGRASFQFSVKDSGIGMSKQFLEHLFEPFEREQTATISGIQGTGLGLTITKNIVEMMDGSITVESEEGKGTEFIVSLQFRTVEDDIKTEYTENLVNQHVLVVDGDINTCTSVSRMLSSFGMRPDWTTQGKEAVARTEFAMEQNNPFQVYIIDWLIPDMNGIETVRQIRKCVGKAATIIILTAYDWTGIEEEAKAAGVTAFCSKPVFLSELREILTAPYRTDGQTENAGGHMDSLFGKRILLVEDNELNREIAQTILEEAGFVIDTAEDGTEAVDIMKNASDGAYDLILMDIQMPIMNGFEATKTIRAMENARASIPIIAMTANAFEEDRHRAESAGMSGHVAKPIDIAHLMDTLKDILDP